MHVGWQRGQERRALGAWDPGSREREHGLDVAGIPGRGRPASEEGRMAAQTTEGAAKSWRALPRPSSADKAHGEGGDPPAVMLR